MLIKEALSNANEAAWSTYSDAIEAQRKIEAEAAARAWSMAELGGKNLARLERRTGIEIDGEISDEVASKLQVLAKEWAEAEAGAKAAASVAVLAGAWPLAKEWAEGKAMAAAEAWTKLTFKIEDIVGT